jgi:hypothetical protein
MKSPALTEMCMSLNPCASTANVGGINYNDIIFNDYQYSHGSRRKQELVKFSTVLIPNFAITTTNV